MLLQRSCSVFLKAKSGKSICWTFAATKRGWDKKARERNKEGSLNNYGLVFAFPIALMKKEMLV